MDILKEAFLNLRTIKLRRFLGSLLYPLQRDWLERQFRKSQTLEAVEETGEIQRAEATNRGRQFHFKHIELEIYFLSADLVRIEWKPGIYPISYGISRKDWPEVETAFQETKECWTISSAKLKVIGCFLTYWGRLAYHLQRVALRDWAMPRRKLGECEPIVRVPATLL